MPKSERAGMRYFNRISHPGSAASAVRAGVYQLRKMRYVPKIPSNDPTTARMLPNRLLFLILKPSFAGL
jgi:hypothetical protein